MTAVAERSRIKKGKKNRALVVLPLLPAQTGAKPASVLAKIYNNATGGKISSQVMSFWLSDYWHTGWVQRAIVGKKTVFWITTAGKQQMQTLQAEQIDERGDR